MSTARPVNIEISSTVDNQTTKHSVQGDLYEKPNATFVRYKEPEPSLGRTFTVLKWSPSELKVIRQGEAPTNMTFVLNEWTSGYYDTAVGRLNLRIFTTKLELPPLRGSNRELLWSYRIYVDSELSGQFDIKVTFF